MQRHHQPRTPPAAGFCCSPKALQKQQPTAESKFNASLYFGSTPSGYRTQHKTSIPSCDSNDHLTICNKLSLPSNIFQ
ncbi:hypothetical protein Nepgr_032246 [Nepenthes gracilis]|uniref:Uncharacterized protein n=1 Tax=Nepenthes gracilis TaxID=150966 RepID=A0AAD3Y5W6_NEPGR|nr:hypothetical protein Nepgr_032246 [Nepenthes gracilis]